MKSFGRVLMTALFVAAAGTAYADTKEAPPVKAETPEQFAQTVATVRKGMEAGGRYEFVTPTDKLKVDTSLDEMKTLIDKSGTVNAMPDRDKLALFNAQEKVNGILTRNDSDRLVCQMVAPVGSHLPVKTCKTYGEIQRSRKSAEVFTRDNVWRQNKEGHGN